MLIYVIFGQIFRLRHDICLTYHFSVFSLQNLAEILFGIEFNPHHVTNIMHLYIGFLDMALVDDLMLKISR